MSTKRGSTVFYKHAQYYLHYIFAEGFAIHCTKCLLLFLLIGVAESLVVDPQLSILEIKSEFLGRVPGYSCTKREEECVPYWYVLVVSTVLALCQHSPQTGFTANEQTLTILQFTPDGRATEDVRYDLRRTAANCVTFQKKIYLTQDLNQVLQFVDDLLELTKGVQATLKDTPPPKVLGRAIKEATAANLLTRIHTLEKRMNELESIKGLEEGCSNLIQYTHSVLLHLLTRTTNLSTLTLLPFRCLRKMRQTFFSGTGQNTS